MQMNDKPEGWRIDTPENRAAMQSPSALADACREERILEARAIVCDSAHNLITDLGCMKGIIPREEGAIGIREGTVRDIAIISRVNRPVCFVIKGFRKDPAGKTVAVLSRREAQERCQRDFISQLVPGDVIDTRVTHLESFGAFADIGCGIVSLLPIDAISVSRIEHPRERLSAGMDIRAVVKSIDNGRITLSQKELEVRKKLFLKRDEIKTSVFDLSLQQLVAFTETADYPSFLTRCMQSILTEFPDTQSAVVFLRTCDLQYSDTISHAVQISCSFTADDTIQLGGLKVRLGDIIADDTLDTRLASQSQWFEEHSGLIIK